MGRKSPGFDPSLPPAADDGEATRTYLNHAAPRPVRPADVPGPSPQAPTEVLPHPPTEVASSVAPPVAPPVTGHPGQNLDVVRYGPGVPAAPPPGQAELTAEHAWHGTGPARPPSRRRERWRRLASMALTIALLTASAVVLYVRFHHPPFHVTGVEITHQARNGCVVDVTGRISTNGSAGTVSYQWLFPVGQQSPRPLNQSVAEGEHAVYVTVTLEGSGQGSAAQKVTLQVLGPDVRAASAFAVVSC
jgi:hypothetical protein